MLLLSGCLGNDQNKVSLQPTTPASSDTGSSVSTEVPSESTNNAQKKVSESPSSTLDTSSDITTSVADAKSIDVDLTVLSSTMVYAEVYNMMTTPDNYRGKTVKMKGQFAVYHDETTNKYYFAVIMADATACCQQGIEFVLAGEPVYPEDYPKEGSNITVTGIFGTYDEDGSTYCQLTSATISK